ncbi:MAG: hypothetical protein RLZZ200_571 [Pseudomonadota bacterium]|jgi:GGDEF domain-containing protein
MQAPATPINEAQRLKSLHALGLLDTAPDEAFDRLAQLATAAFNVPLAVVSLVDRKRQWFKSRQGLRATETSRDVSFCGHAILGDEPFVVPDAANDSRFQDNPLVTGEPGIRFYAGQPLHAPDGHRIGTLCVLDHRPRDFSARERQLLRELAIRVEREISLRATSAMDPVTQLANRQGFDALVRQALESCRRHGQEACYGMIRLDGASDMGLSLGEAAGHAVLRQFSEHFARAFVNGDILAHCAPGEFRFFTPGRGERDMLDVLDLLAQQTCGSVGGRSYLDPVWFAGTVDVLSQREAGSAALGALAAERLAYFRARRLNLMQSFAGN